MKLDEFLFRVLLKSVFVLYTAASVAFGYFFATAMAFCRLGVDIDFEVMGTLSRQGVAEWLFWSTYLALWFLTVRWCLFKLITPKENFFGKEKAAVTDWVNEVRLPLGKRSLIVAFGTVGMTMPAVAGNALPLSLTVKAYGQVPSLELVLLSAAFLLLGIYAAHVRELLAMWEKL